jgi:hypothetical protein
MVWIGCTGVGKEKIEPFAAYLANGHELTPYFREWLIAMLRRDKEQRHHLIYKKRVGRPKPTTPASPQHGDSLVISACSSSGSIEPFVDWLDSGRELTPALRFWLVSMLRREKSQSHILDYMISGRRPSLDRVMSDLELEGRYFDLCDVTITDDFRHDVLVDTLRFFEAPMEEDGSKRTYFFGIRVLDELSEESVDVIVRFEVGKKLNDFQIHHLLAAEFDTSVSTVKRTLRAHRTARAIE